MERKLHSLRVASREYWLGPCSSQVVQPDGVALDRRSDGVSLDSAIESAIEMCSAMS